MFSGDDFSKISKYFLDKKMDVTAKSSQFEGRSAVALKILKE
jgi:hypothetical protein